jgi:radical SAM superfamily enzyme YgiQ (UPF0313 family)
MYTERSLILKTNWIKTMKVLLISANTETINMPVLPVGLACVAASVQRAGHDVKLVNLMAKEQGRTLLTEALREFQPEVIGISVRNIDDQVMQDPRFLLDPVKEIVAHCRSLSSAPIILGGAGYSIFPQSALAYLGADVGIQGEGEAALPMLLARLAGQMDLSGIPGLVLASPSIQEKASPIKSMDDFPLPRPNAFPELFPTLGDQSLWLPLQTRRGCPMQCSYCSTATIEGRILRKRSPEIVVEALARYVDAGFDHFFFVDNTFNIPLSYAKALCDHIAAAALPIQWRAIVYPWKIDEELVEKMAKAGCVEVSFGFESGSKAILRSMNKRFQPEEVRRISGMLKKYGISRMGFLLLGGPGETRNTVEESLSFADSLALESMKVTTGIRIYPYTALAQIAVSENVILPHHNLLFPTFYLARGLEPWLDETVQKWMRERVVNLTCTFLNRNAQPV